VNANLLEILLRVQQGMTFHFWAITFLVSAKILIFHCILLDNFKGDIKSQVFSEVTITNSTNKEYHNLSSFDNWRSYFLSVCTLKLMCLWGAAYVHMCVWLGGRGSRNWCGNICCTLLASSPTCHPLSSWGNTRRMRNLCSLLKNLPNLWVKSGILYLLFDFSKQQLTGNQIMQRMSPEKP